MDRGSVKHVSMWKIAMMTSSNGNIFRVTGHLCGEFTGHRWISRTKASDAELWCFLWSAPEKKRLSKQSRGWWFETPSRPLWCHCNGIAWLYMVFPHACITYISEIFTAILTHLRWHNPLVTWSDVLFNLWQSRAVSRMYRYFAPIVCPSWDWSTPVFIIAILPPYPWDTGKY